MNPSLACVYFKTSEKKDSKKKILLLFLLLENAN